MAAGDKPSTLSAQMMKTLAEADLKNPIRLKHATNRNIIFIGKSRSGKSTAVEILKNPFRFVRPTSIFAGTKKPSVSPFTVEVPISIFSTDPAADENTQSKTNFPKDIDRTLVTSKGLASFNINIIDTPGLFEVVRSDAKARDIETLETMILQCMKAEITKIHCIFFVIAYNGTVNRHDLEALDNFLTLFSGAREFLHILVTKCEGLNDDEKELIKEEICDVPQFKALIEGCSSKPKFFFTGACSRANYDGGYEDVVSYEMKEVLAMRKALFHQIFMGSNSFPLEVLQMSETIKEKALHLWSALQEQSPPYEYDRLTELEGWTFVLPPEIQSPVTAFLSAARILQDLSQKKTQQ